tara:strand:+ start:403 stop:1359 length:957 start_codon:yes stop_codon:yes gene_type:complete
MNYKIIFNSYHKDAPATMNYYGAFCNNPNFSFYDVHHYDQYDIALFMPYGKDIEELIRAKNINENIKIGLIDPRGELDPKVVDLIDFFIIDSIEMSDFIKKYSKPYFIFYEYPIIKNIIKNHSNKDKISIAYHGNKMHLENMSPRITDALIKLSENYNIEFIAIYNIEELGLWNFQFPENFKINHVQWSENIYNDILCDADIGIVPALIDNSKLDQNNNYIMKFKMPSNPGRLIIFSKLGIPVVADFLPSHFEFIKNDVNGYLAYSTSSWYYSLEKLILNPKKRNEFSFKMNKEIEQKVDYKIQNIKFKKFITNVLNG